MRLSATEQESPRLDLTPLIDVVFLLLIFFMVTTTFDRQTALKVELPTATDNPSEVPPDRLELIIDPEGRYFIEGNELVNPRRATVQSALERASGGRTDIPLIIRADARSPHQSVVTAMDAAAQAGFAQLSIATTPDREGD